jgi:hypothetical protein
LGFEVFPPDIADHPDPYEWLNELVPEDKKDRWDTMDFSDYDGEDLHMYIILKDPFGYEWEWTLTDRINELREFLISRKDIPFEDNFNLHYGMEVN